MTDIADASAAADEQASAALPYFTETIPSAPGHISALASANAPFLFFNDAPFAGHEDGVCSVTLTASRLVATMQNGKGASADLAVVAHLRCSFPALKRLRKMIDDLVLHAETPEGVRN